MDDINNLESTVKKGSEREVTLMEMKDITARHSKENRNSKRKLLSEINNELSKMVMEQTTN